MSENLSSGSSGSENLVSPPPRQARPPAQPAPRRNLSVARPADTPKQSGSSMADEKAKLLKKMKASKPAGLKDNKKQD